VSSRPTQRKLVWAIGLALACAISLFIASVLCAQDPDDLWPVLARVVGLLRRTDMIPVAHEAQVYPLGPLQWVRRMDWIDDERLIISSCPPSRSEMRSFHFRLLTPDGFSDLGDVAITQRLGVWFRITTSPAGELCVFLDMETNCIAPAFALSASRQPREVPLSSSILESLRVARVGRTGPGEGPSHHEPIQVILGSGEVLAEGDIPEGMAVYGYWWVPHSHRDGKFRVAAPTIEDGELSRSWEAPVQISVLQLPEEAGLPCRLLRRFDYASRREVPSPRGELRWELRTLLLPDMNADGSRIAFGELLRWETGPEQACLWRLWVWDEATDRRTLIATRAEYGAAERHDRSFTVLPDGTVRQKGEDFDIWARPTQMMCALSPSGKKLAYVAGEDLHIVDLP